MAPLAFAAVVVLGFAIGYQHGLGTALLCAGYAAALYILGVVLAVIPVVGQLILWFAAVPWLRSLLGLAALNKLFVVDALTLIISGLISIHVVAKIATEATPSEQRVDTQ